ncbi:MAG: hypothetical protein AB7N24_01275 [Dehalococcoidia bacterium]
MITTTSAGARGAAGYGAAFATILRAAAGLFVHCLSAPGRPVRIHRKTGEVRLR